MDLKQKMALAMAAVMLFHLPFSSMGTVSFAKEADDAADLIEDYEISAYDIGTPASAKRVSTPSDAERDCGALRVEMIGAAPSTGSEWDVFLEPGSDDGEAQTGNLHLPAAVKGSHSDAWLTMEGIPIGDYTLRLVQDPDNGTSYLPYEQAVSIGNNLTTVKLINADPRDYGYEDSGRGKTNYGILAMGDFNGDGAIDDMDLESLVRDLAEKGTDAANDRHDLNGDGIVDLLDVAGFAKYYDNRFIEDNREANPATSAWVTEEEVSVATESNALRREDSASVEEIFSGSAERPLELETEDTISDDKPAVIATEFRSAKPMEGLVIDPVAGSENSIVDGEIIVMDDEGAERVFLVRDGKVEETAKAKTRAVKNFIAAAIGQLLEAVPLASYESAAGVKAISAAEADTSAKMAKPIVIDLGGQVAVKKITIKVTKTLAEDPKLVDISKVEFFDDMADRIPEPELAIPEGLSAAASDKAFTLTWKNMPNVASYEVTISGLTDKKVQMTDTVIVETNRAEVTRFAGGDLLNGSDYVAVVRSVNGSWKSEGAAVTVRPDTSALPPAPENVVLDPGYGLMKVSWKDMKDTQTYTLHYSEVLEEDSLEEKVSVELGAVYNYTITGLKNDTEYEIWLTGHNKNGEGPESIHYRARTSTLNPPETPNYKLINKPRKGAELTDHIESVTLANGKNSDGSTGNANVVADGNYATSWILEDWDAGYYYGNRMPIVKFDGEYKINTIVLIPDENQEYTYSGGKIFYLDENGKEQEATSRMSRLTSNGKYYYMFTSYAPFTTKQVRLATYAYSTCRRISVSD